MLRPPLGAAAEPARPGNRAACGSLDPPGRAEEGRGILPGMNTQSSASAPAPTFRLWLMMVLEFVIWGAWLPLIWGYMGAAVADGGLGFSGAQIAWVGSAFAIASVSALSSVTVAGASV